MSTSLSSLADNLSEINKKDSADEFIDRKEMSEKFPNIYIDFVIEILINFLYY